jgi:SAM-dependent methyltransferase
MLILFAVSLFVSSALLFLVEPMFAKMVLPLLGGSPSVWNTCVVFFQAMLLCGYLYAHAVTAWLEFKWQTALHAVIVLATILLLPIAVPGGWTPPTGHNPTFWLLGLLLVSVGLPFFVVSSTAPLLQRWFSATDHNAATDPYFLYAASNAGSLLALLSYPLFFEPLLRLHAQSVVWTAGYLLLAGLILACTLATLRRATGGADSPRRDASSSRSDTRRVADTPFRAASGAGGEGAEFPLDDVIGEGTSLTWRRRLKWLALSAAPSSLLLGVTTFLSTDIAAIPLLWILPLVLYLLTFIVAFAVSSERLRTIAGRLLPISVLPLVLLLVSQTSQPAFLVIPVHLLAFLVTALVCHLELARSRPAPRYLTEFYLCVSLGGLLGGLFNTLVAPVLFARVLEYPLALVLACLLRPDTRNPGTEPGRATGSVVRVSAVTGVTFAVVLTASRQRMENHLLLALLSIPIFLAFTLSRRPVPFAGAIAGTLAAGLLYSGYQGAVIHAERTFFGVYRVVDQAEGYRSLFHGTTLHGRQSLDPARIHEPLTYYHRGGPIGQVFAALASRLESGRIGVVGLGTGTLAAYATPLQRWTFYEIDPAVIRLARDSGYFSFLTDTRADIQIVPGDARLSLAHAAPHEYDLLVLDAFSSDAIPMHLMTREALALYRSRLASGGILAFHISNRHLALEHVLARLAADAGMIAVVQTGPVRVAEVSSGIESSQWLLMAAAQGDFGGLGGDKRWLRAEANRATPLWTDDFSNILSAFAGY